MLEGRANARHGCCAGPKCWSGPESQSPSICGVDDTNNHSLIFLRQSFASGLGNKLTAREGKVKVIRITGMILRAVSMMPVHVRC